MVLSSIISAMVSVERLANFLAAPELQPDARTILPPPPPTTDDTEVDAPKVSLEQQDVVLSIRDGEFKWSESAVEPTLEGINLDVKMGELLGVLGRVGCGKVRIFLTNDLARLTKLSLR